MGPPKEDPPREFVRCTATQGCICFDGHQAPCLRVEVIDRPPLPTPEEVAELRKEGKELRKKVQARLRGVPQPPEPSEVPRQPAPEFTICQVCRQPLSPGTVTMPAEGGGVRHVKGSPACRR